MAKKTKKKAPAKRGSTVKARGISAKRASAKKSASKPSKTAKKKTAKKATKKPSVKAAKSTKKPTSKLTKSSPKKATKTVKKPVKKASAAPEKTATKKSTKRIAPKKKTRRAAKPRPGVSRRRMPAKLSDRDRSAQLENLLSLITDETQRKQERIVEESKFQLGTDPEWHPKEHELPSEYGRNRVILLVVEPKFVFTYWEITSDSFEEASKDLGPNPKLTLRFYDTTDGLPPEESESWDIEVFDRLGNWYLKLENAEQQLMIDIGIKDGAGRFRMISRSNCMKLPRISMASPGPIKWMTVSPEGDKVITSVEEYTDADHELLRRILGPYFYGLLMKGKFSSVAGSSMEAVFQDITTLKHPEILPSSSPTAWLTESTKK